jgi:hypothetical protein
MSLVRDGGIILPKNVSFLILNMTRIKGLYLNGVKVCDGNPYIRCLSLSFPSTILSMPKNSTMNVTVFYNPTNCSDKRVRGQTGNTSIAQVIQSGYVTSLVIRSLNVTGQTTLQVFSIDGPSSPTIQVRVS